MKIDSEVSHPASAIGNILENEHAYSAPTSSRGFPHGGLAYSELMKRMSGDRQVESVGRFPDEIQSRKVRLQLATRTLRWTTAVPASIGIVYGVRYNRIHSCDGQFMPYLRCLRGTFFSILWFVTSMISSAVTEV